MGIFSSLEITTAFMIWNPDRNLFVIPYLDHPVTWYGFLFACSFLLGYFIVRKMFIEILSSSEKPLSIVHVEATRLADRLSILLVSGGIIGARLGHVFFYGWPFYREHPFDIIKIWEGGLASHGGALGAMIALGVFLFWIRRSFPKMTFLTILDAIVIPAAFLGGAVRIGNFINQEITGIPTQLPWAVIFRHPLDGLANTPVHPVQIYESIFYFVVFMALGSLWMRDKKSLGKGLISGCFFLLVFLFRFAIENLKMPQNEYFDLSHWLSMGQLLSLPFIVLGICLLTRTFFYARKAG
jgi:phosphatidylglycerol---prolipoprotein diacylglyceryl transferase